MSEKEPGYVYILTNPSFREDWIKIGKSSRHVDVRSKEILSFPIASWAKQKNQYFYNRKKQII